MPELPEVETVRRSLEPHLVGLKITRVQILLPKIVRHLPSERFQQILTGREFQALARRGKYLLAQLDEGWTLVVHLGMSGRLIYAPAGENCFGEHGQTIPRHVHAVITLDDGGLLYYHDLRQFGYLTVCRTGEFTAIKGLQNLGPEPLGEEFKRETLQAALCGRKGRIKQLLLDQNLIAGIGNIYADESLFAAGIHPERTGDSLTLEEFEKLYQAIRKVLQQGIEYRGTSITDYVDGEGQPGDFQNCLQVYRRTGQECLCCAGVIQRVKVGGRSSHFCPHCQPKRAAEAAAKPRAGKADYAEHYAEKCAEDCPEE